MDKQWERETAKAAMMMSKINDCKGHRWHLHRSPQGSIMEPIYRCEFCPSQRYLDAEIAAQIKERTCEHGKLDECLECELARLRTQLEDAERRVGFSVEELKRRQHPKPWNEYSEGYNAGLHSGICKLSEAYAALKDAAKDEGRGR